MAQVVNLFRDTAFDPETLKKLCEAFDLASTLLHDNGRPDVVNEVIAARIIAMAENGELDPIVLADSALVGLGFKNAS
jgi:hypothetical protein